MRVPAVRALRPGRARRLQNLDRLLALVDARQHPQRRLALVRIEAGELAQQLLEIGCAHRRGPAQVIRRQPPCPHLSATNQAVPCSTRTEPF